VKTSNDGRDVRQIKKYENNSQGQSSRSNLAKFQSFLVFTMGRIRTTLHHFLISNFQDFVRTDRCRKKQYLLAAGAQVIILSRGITQFYLGLDVTGVASGFCSGGERSAVGCWGFPPARPTDVGDFPDDGDDDDRVLLAIAAHVIGFAGFTVDSKMFTRVFTLH